MNKTGFKKKKTFPIGHKSPTNTQQRSGFISFPILNNYFFSLFWINGEGNKTVQGLKEIFNEMDTCNSRWTNAIDAGRDT